MMEEGVTCRRNGRKQTEHPRGSLSQRFDRLTGVSSISDGSIGFLAVLSMAQDGLSRFEGAQLSRSTI